ncbi:MAG TPA: TetR/AcrR family transcriptional regulator [Ilumatobacteraceae bacterium]|nr:TetR/AcrR family transcriptional regulator [Ilumatobacteraceae bacterium]HRB02491.1 TetR/AcrR family transcriptional regulator [Ilumatobacteraceae bacterium]
MATEFPEKRPRDAAAIRRMTSDATSEKVSDHVHQHPETDPLDVWTRGDRASRKPRFTRDDIAEAAIRIADAEGFDAVSMRRIAAELDAGTMTLYHYIRTKDELLSLIIDAFMGEVILPEGSRLPPSWREAMTVIARRSRDAIRRHPWMFDISDDPSLGPNGVRHFDQSLQALASLDVDLQGKFDVLMAVDEYVFGFCMHERNNHGPGDDNDQLSPALANYLADLIATGDYPAMESMTEGSSLDEVWTRIAGAMRDETRFDRNLKRLLDGFERSFGASDSRDGEL